MRLSTLAPEAGHRHSLGAHHWPHFIGRETEAQSRDDTPPRFVTGFMAVILEKFYPFLAVPHATLAVKACSLTHWTAGEFPRNDDPPHPPLTSLHLTTRLLTQLHTFDLRSTPARLCDFGLVI